MRAITTFLFILLLFPGVPAHADTATEAGELKSALEEVFAVYADSVLGGQQLGYEGEIDVTPGEGVYTAVIPQVSINSVTGFRIDIGDIRVNAKRGGGAGEEGAWILTAALPRVMPIHDAAQEHIADLRVGKQYFAGAWVPSLGAFTRLDISYGDIKAETINRDVFSINLDSLKFAVNMKPDGKGNWAGPRSMEIKGVTLRSNDQKHFSSFQGSVGRLATWSDVKDISLNHAKLAADRAKARGETDNKAMTTAEAIQSVREQVLSLPGAYRASVEISDADLGFYPDDPKDARVKRRIVRAKLPHALLSADMTGLREKRGGAKAILHLEELTVEGLPEPLDGLVPRLAHIDLRFDNVPMQGLTNIIAAIMDEMSKGVASDNDEIKRRVSDLVVAVPEALSSSGAEFTIWDSFVTSEDLHLTLEGRLTADISSPIVAVGRMIMKIEGLDELIRAYREIDPDNPIAQQYIQGLVPAQLAGKLTNPADGHASIRTYDVAFTPEGNVTLNGSDISALKKLLRAQR